VDLLKDNVDQYLFTSTRAVYTDFTQDVMDEDAPVGPKDIPESEWDGYGPNKVLAERVVQIWRPDTDYASTGYRRSG
jgi:nucleoside-diphosphate-sugar epimerase